mmetsp:Transcript_21791/g.51689  ORF Transcript_21791/g.51689 Transcript_21791/m.51689 type:complete len:289 (-) Transcript_21791:2874-3740(-)
MVTRVTVAYESPPLSFSAVSCETEQICCASCPSVTRLSEAVSARARPIPPSLSPSFPPSGLCAAVGRSGKVIRGVAGFWLATIRISRMRGMPSVTLPPPTPAKWKVLSVICVAGSPMDWAASAPHISPGCARCILNLDSTSPSTHSKASGVSRWFFKRTLECKVARTSAKKFVVALACAFRENSSVPGTTMSRSSSRSTISTTTTGCSLVGTRMSIAKSWCAFSSRRVRHTGMGQSVVCAARSSCSLKTSERSSSRVCSSALYSSCKVACTSRERRQSSSTFGSSHES